jgi:hypothetical protein
MIVVARDRSPRPDVAQAGVFRWLVALTACMGGLRPLTGCDVSEQENDGGKKHAEIEAACTGSIYGGLARLLDSQS